MHFIRRPLCVLAGILAVWIADKGFIVNSR